ncbi:MAG: DCC1-like thiol-disulfide oxidoreductase family protein [Steroidobacteraceae bacterium]
MTSPSTDNYVLYDGDCPFCRNYVAMQRLRAAIGPVRLVDARAGGPEVEAARAAGYDLDEGMLLSYEGRLYHGAACMNMLALLGDDRGLVARFMNWLFGSRDRASFLYPLLRAGRNLTLRLLSRRRLDGRPF